VSIVHNGQEAELPLVMVRVTKGKFPALFGVSWLEKIRLNYEKLFPAKNVNKVSNIVQSFKQKFPKVFSGVPGPMKGHEANIILRPDAVLVFIPHRTASVPIWGKVEQELTWMVDSGFLEPTFYEERGPPIVAVQKGNGNIRTCRDYSCTFNPTLTMEPGIDDLFLFGQIFCKTDLSQEYLQLMVGQSRKILSLSTHINCLKVCRLLYGIASVPVIIQQIITIFLYNILG
jgi:hypothetical protein